MKLSKRNTLFIAVAILLLGAGLRFLRTTVVEMPYRDSIGYVRFAQAAAADGWEQAYRAYPDSAGIPPLLPAVLTAGELLNLGAVPAGITLMLVSSLLTAVAVAMIARELWQDRYLTLAALFLGSVLPPLVRSSVEIMREPPYWCFASWAIFFLIYALNLNRRQPDATATRQTVFMQKFSYWAAIAAFGLCAALAMLSRREGVELLLFFGVWLLGFGWSRQQIVKIILGKCAAAALAALMISVPVLLVQFTLAEAGSSWQALQLRSITYYCSRILAK